MSKLALLLVMKDQAKVDFVKAKIEATVEAVVEQQNTHQNDGAQQGAASRDERAAGCGQRALQTKQDQLIDKVT